MNHFGNTWWRARIGFSHDSAGCVSAVSNMSSAAERPSHIDEFITTELAAGRILGSVEPGSSHSIHINSFGLLPKGHTPGKWRLIVDLSFPAGGSVNPGLCSLHYTIVGVACQFKTVPVHPSDRHLLDMRWCGHTYVDKVLPFGPPFSTKALQYRC